MRLVGVSLVVASSACGPAGLIPSKPVELARTSLVNGAWLAQDDTWLYWTDPGERLSMSGSLHRLKKSGGEAEQLASGLDDPMQIAVDGSFIYWVERAGLWRMPIGGGTPQAMVADGARQARQMVVAGTKLIIADSSHVYSHDLTSGSQSLPSIELARFLDSVSGLTVTSTHVVWVDSQSTGSIGRRALDASDTQTVLFADIPNGGVIVSDRDTLWWAQSRGDQVFSAAPGEMPVERGTFEGGSVRLAADGDVFVSAVLKLSLIRKGSNTPVLVAETDHLINSMVIDARSLYFATEGWGIYRLDR